MVDRRPEADGAAAERWVRDGAHVRAFFGGIYVSGESPTHATGRVIAFQSSPTVLIETEDGHRVSWALHLCEELPPPSP